MLFRQLSFGWVPVLLWILIGGIFFGAVTDFGALYASVKNEGKSMGLLIEKYIGKTGTEVISSVLLAIYTDRYRSLCGYGCMVHLTPILSLKQV